MRLGNNKKTELEPTSVNIDLGNDEVNVFRDSVDAGHRVEGRTQKVFILSIILLVLYLVAIVFPKELFSPGMNGIWRGSDRTFLTVFVSELSDNLEAILAWVTGGGVAGKEYAPTMMRYIIVPLAGMGLAVSGAVYQGVFRNALVAPSTLGVMAGGQFGMVLWVLIVVSTGSSLMYGLSFDEAQGGSLVDYLNTSLGLSLTSFLGCFAVVAIVLLTLKAAGSQKTSGIMMIITGQVVAGVFGVFTTLVRYYFVTLDSYGEVAEFLQEVAVASFYRSYTWIEVICVALPLIITFLVVRALSSKMMVLSLDETEQRSLGVNTRLMQIGVVGLCTLLTAVIISFCGTIGFVGFLVPHLARRLVGPNFKYLLPASMVMGGIFVLGAYFLLDVTLGGDYAQLVGIFISIFGAVVFLVTALRGKGVQYGAFK